MLEAEVEVLTITLYLEAHVNPFDDLPFPIHWDFLFLPTEIRIFNDKFTVS